MIRPFRPSDMDAVLAVWLEASLAAHDFIPASFWESNVAAMRDLYLPKAETHVHEEDGAVTGFLCLDNDRLAALFVDPRAQGRGIGSRLLDTAKGLRRHLRLTVYERNSRAVAFYARHGFAVTGRQVDESTGEHELIMHCGPTGGARR